MLTDWATSQIQLNRGQIKVCFLSEIKKTLNQEFKWPQLQIKNFIINNFLILFYQLKIY